MSDTDALTLATKAVDDILDEYGYPVDGQRLARAALEAAGVLADGAQPLPVPNGHPSCHDLAVELLSAWAPGQGRDRLIADMGARKAHGLAKYGVPLQPFNGREALVDAYQEVQDLVVYLIQFAFELREGNSLHHYGETSIELLRNRVLAMAVQLAGLQPEIKGVAEA